MYGSLDVATQEWTAVFIKKLELVRGTAREYQDVMEWSVGMLVDLNGAQHVLVVPLVTCIYVGASAETGSSH